MQGDGSWRAARAEPRGSRPRLSITLAPRWAAGRMVGFPDSLDSWDTVHGDNGSGQLGWEIAYGLELGAGRGVLTPYGGR